MKRMIALLCVFSMGFNVYGTPRSEQIQNHIQRQLISQQKKLSLSTFVASQLQEYYGRKDFADPAHTTGWYRVDRFLTWLKTNENALEKSTFQFYSLTGNTPRIYKSTVTEFLQKDPAEISPEIWRGFWTYLGIRYLSEVYHTAFNFSQLVLIGTDKETSSVQAGGLFINTQESMSLPEIINTGMHEGTHFLPVLENPAATPLNELAAFYTEHNFGLPVKKNDVQSFADGTRDIRRLHRVYPDFPLYQEYNAFVIGLILNPQLTTKKALSLYDINEQAQLSVWETLLSLWAAEHNRFMLYQPVPWGQEEHVIAVEQNDFAQTAALFGFTQEDINNWLSNPATIIDLGDLVWPGTTGPKESVVLQKKQKGGLFVGNLRRVNKQEFMSLMMGPFAADPGVITFYRKLTTLLPENIKKTALERWPVVVEDHYTPAMARNLIQPYEQEWNEAIIQALQEAPAELPVPEGYL